MPITAIIIDDEPQSRKLLHHLLREYVPDVQVVAECEDLPNGVKSIRRLHPQLVFLDIEMPGHSGLELMDFFDEDDMDFRVIFTTAYNQYAIQAFSLSAVDYLLKPIEGEALKAAVQRYLKQQVPEREQYSALKENLQEGAKRLAVPIGQQIRFLEIARIMVLKADNSYTEILMENGEKLIVSRTLKNFEEALGTGGPLIRAHKSYMVNRHFVEAYVKSDGGYLLMNNKMEIPVSGDRMNNFLEGDVFIRRP